MKAPITAILFWIGTAIAAFLAFKFFSWDFNTLAFTALIIAAVFFLIGLKAYRIHKALNPKPTTQAPNNEQNVEQKSKPAAAATEDVEKTAPKVPESSEAKPKYKGFSSSIVYNEKDYDLISQIFDVCIVKNDEGKVFPVGTIVDIGLVSDSVEATVEVERVGSIMDKKIVLMITRWIKEGYLIRSKVDSEDPFSVVIGFFAPRLNEKDYKRSGIPSKVFKLAGANSTDYIDYAEDLCEGDEIEFTYDNYNDRYESDYGYLPKSANSFISDSDTVGFVKSVETDDDDKLIIKVMVYERLIIIDSPEELLKADKLSPYDVRTYTVKGVTFKTGVSGRKSRQTILRAIHFEDPPFDEPYKIVPKVYEFEGEPAVGLYVNGDEHEQIGNLPKEAAAEIAGMMDRYIDSDIEVYGGGDHNWGAEITLRFKKEE